MTWDDKFRVVSFIVGREMKFLMKYEWRKQEKEIYSAKQEPSLIEIPGQSYIMICGEGDPNKEDFSERVGVLYSLAFKSRMDIKKPAQKVALRRSTVSMRTMQSIRWKESGRPLIRSILWIKTALFTGLC